MRATICIDWFKAAARIVTAWQSNLNDTGWNVFRFASNHSHRTGQQSIVLWLFSALAIRLGEIRLCWAGHCPLRRTRGDARQITTFDSIELFPMQGEGQQWNSIEMWCLLYVPMSKWCRVSAAGRASIWLYMQTRISWQTLWIYDWRMLRQSMP